MKNFKILSKVKSHKTKMPSLSDIFSSLKQSRCLSANQNPYEAKSKSSNLKQKPKIFVSTKPKIKNLSKPETKIKDKKIVSSKKLKKSSKNVKFIKGNLGTSEDKFMLVAPKVYDYQIFKDIYDLNGNLDRVLDTSQSSIESGREYSIVDRAALEEIYRMNESNEKRKLGTDEDYFIEGKKDFDCGNEEFVEKFNDIGLD